MWLLRLIVQLEPLAFAERHRRALTERRFTVVQGVDGMGYVTGEVSATDAATIDGMLAATARSLGATDPRTEQQRRADLFADLLLGRLTLDQSGKEEEEYVGDETGSDWLEVENIDPDTGELLGTQLQRINGDGEPLGEPAKTAPQTQTTPNRTPPILKRRETLRIGVVVPLSSLLGTDESPGELADRSGFIPGEVLRQHIAETLDRQPRPGAIHAAAHRRRWPASRCHRTRPLRLHPVSRSDQDPRRLLQISHLHRPRRQLRPRPPRSTSARPYLRDQYGSVLPTTPPRQDLRLACCPPGRLRRRLDHARRRTLPMPRRAATNRSGSLRLRICQLNDQTSSTEASAAARFTD